ncbi:N-acetylmuramoyl-L-alanine amidase [Novosphingobium panipatense]
MALEDRPDIARRLNADLFISIHADSAEADRPGAQASTFFRKKVRARLPNASPRVRTGPDVSTAWP